jgi:hypothetical protein
LSTLFLNIFLLIFGIFKTYKLASWIANQASNIQVLFPSRSLLSRATRKLSNDNILYFVCQHLFLSFRKFFKSLGASVSTLPRFQNRLSILSLSCRRTFILYHHSFCLSTSFFKFSKVFYVSLAASVSAVPRFQNPLSYLLLAVGELLYYIIILFLCQQLFLRLESYYGNLGASVSALPRFTNCLPILSLRCWRTFILYHCSFCLSTSFFEFSKVFMSAWRPAFRPFRAFTIRFQLLIASCRRTFILYHHSFSLSTTFLSF